MDLTSPTQAEDIIMGDIPELETIDHTPPMQD
jgi:hypothetical protein